jgi:putative transposase
VKEIPSVSFAFEDLKGVRKKGSRKHKGKRPSKKFRTQLNRWPYRRYQKLMEYKSAYLTVYVNPRGTSSECPVCGGKLEHPEWRISRCKNCGVDYDRDRLSSLEITRRALRLCGQPFAASADASWQSLKDEYLYAGHAPNAARTGGTEAANAPNKNVYTKIHF